MERSPVSCLVSSLTIHACEVMTIGDLLKLSKIVVVVGPYK